MRSVYIIFACLVIVQLALARSSSSYSCGLSSQCEHSTSLSGNQLSFATGTIGQSYYITQTSTDDSYHTQSFQTACLTQNTYSFGWTTINSGSSGDRNVTKVDNCSTSSTIFHLARVYFNSPTSYDVLYDSVSSCFKDPCLSESYVHTFLNGTQVTYYIALLGHSGSTPALWLNLGPFTVRLDYQCYSPTAENVFLTQSVVIPPVDLNNAARNVVVLSPECDISYKPVISAVRFVSGSSVKSKPRPNNSPLLPSEAITQLEKEEDDVNQF